MCSEKKEEVVADIYERNIKASAKREDEAQS